MGIPVVSGSSAICSFGGVLTLNAVGNVMIENKPVLTIKDNIPGANIIFSGVCSSPMKGPTPTPCVFAPAGPWFMGTLNTKVKYMPVVDNSCSLMCAFGGKITVTFPGALRTLVK